MNLRLGLKRTLICATVVGAVALVPIVASSVRSYQVPVTLALSEVALVLGAVALWYGGNWIVRGFRNST